MFGRLHILFKMFYRVTKKGYFGGHLVLLLIWQRKLSVKEVTNCLWNLSSQGEHIISATSYLLHPSRQRECLQCYMNYFTLVSNPLLWNSHSHMCLCFFFFLFLFWQNFVFLFTLENLGHGTSVHTWKSHYSTHLILTLCSFHYNYIILNLLVNF